MIASKIVLQYGAVMCVHLCVLLHSFVITSMEKDCEDEYIGVWRSHERRCLRPSPLIHHHIDRE